MVGGHDSRDFTALGDPMNIAAHLASQAAAAEILITQAVVDRAPTLARTNIEPRHVSLEGYLLDAFVLQWPATAPA
jgi:class 3 adenylate cyclase